MDIENRVKRIVMDELGCDESEVVASASFESLDADSLDVVELVMAFEEEFEILIPDEDADRIRTVGDAYAYIKSHTNEN